MTGTLAHFMFGKDPPDPSDSCQIAIDENTGPVTSSSPLSLFSLSSFPLRRHHFQPDFNTSLMTAPSGQLPWFKVMMHWAASIPMAITEASSHPAW